MRCRRRGCRRRRLGRTLLLARRRSDVVVIDAGRPRKPDPESYLAATQLLSVNAADCLAIEGSANGALSAIAAGCAVVVVGKELIALDDRHLRVPSLCGTSLDELLQQYQSVRQ